MTHLDMVNRILVRLREDTVTAITDNDYSKLVGEFVADAYDEVLDEHSWECLRHQINVSLVAGRNTYNLSALVANGGDIPNTEQILKKDSELQWLENTPQVWMYDDTNDTASMAIAWVTPEAMREAYSANRTLTAVEPYYFTIYPVQSGGATTLQLEVYPFPQNSRILTMEFWTRPDRLTITGTTDTTQIAIPDRPVMQLALMYAINERGEEMGEPGNLAEKRYISALSTAIDKDIGAYSRGDRYEWSRD